jgi:hypothetical protein
MAAVKDTLADGELQVEAGVLRYEFARTRFRLPLDEIVLAGEYTTSNGPAAIDYFLVFFTRDGLRYDASFYAKGRDAALEMLSDYWQRRNRSSGREPARCPRHLEYSSMIRSMAFRQTLQNPTSSRVNMMQSTSGR